MSFLKWLNPFEWSALAVRIVGALLLLGVLAWWLNSKLENHYTAEIKAETQAATDKATAAVTARQLDNEQNRTKALDAKVKKLEAVAANTKRVADADNRLSDALRASATAKTEISACVQRADTLDIVQQTIRGFAARVVQECDRHVADKVELTEAWAK